MAPPPSDLDFDHTEPAKIAFKRSMDGFMQPPVKRQLMPGEKGPPHGWDRSDETDDDDSWDSIDSGLSLTVGKGRYIETAARVAQNARIPFRESFRFWRAHPHDPLTAVSYTHLTLPTKRIV